MLTDALLVVAQTLLLVLVAPLWPALVAALRARLQMRRGAPVVQRWRDLVRLAGKETVLSEHATPFARLAPYLVLATAVTVSTWVPVLTTRGALGFAGDLVTTVAMFAAMRVLLALLALECGTSFGAFAASRHLMLSALAEPALVLSVFAIALGAGSTDLARIAASVSSAEAGWLTPSHLLAFAAVALVVVSETGRVPVDNPFTHLELTMIHEGLVLDVSGRHLAVVEWAAAIRQLVLFTLAANLFLPWGLAREITPAALGIAFGAWLAKLAVFAVAVALVESVLARMRLFRVPELLGTAFLLSLIALASGALSR
jgi:formate hydrogenlyase subunit 4